MMWLLIDFKWAQNTDTLFVTKQTQTVIGFVACYPARDTVLSYLIQKQCARHGLRMD